MRRAPHHAIQKHTNYFCLTIPLALSVSLPTFTSLWASYSLYVTCANMHVSLSRNSIGGIGTRIETWKWIRNSWNHNPSFCALQQIQTHKRTLTQTKSTHSADSYVTTRWNVFTDCFSLHTPKFKFTASHTLWLHPKQKKLSVLD